MTLVYKDTYICLMSTKASSLSPPMAVFSRLALGSLLVFGAAARPLTGRAPSSDKKVIIQLFEWTWDR